MELPYPIPEIITNNGWQFKEHCRCSGQLKYKFRSPNHKGFLLVLLVHANRFKLLYKATTYLNYTDIQKIDQATEILNSIH